MCMHILWLRVGRGPASSCLRVLFTSVHLGSCSLRCVCRVFDCKAPDGMRPLTGLTSVRQQGGLPPVCHEIWSGCLFYCRLSNSHRVSMRVSVHSAFLVSSRAGDLAARDARMC